MNPALLPAAGPRMGTVPGHVGRTTVFQSCFLRPAFGRPPRLAFLPWIACLGACAALTAPAAEPDAAVADKPSFLRLSRDDRDRPVSLDTAVVEYAEVPGTEQRRPSLRVDLIAAVHVGSRTYYDMLDRLFADYDAVLYELVAPPHARVPKPGRRPSGAIGTAQHGITQVLGLEFQLDQVDYTAANFVHADLSPKEFDAAMAKRGESWWTMFTRLMRESMARVDKADGGAAELGIGDMFGLLFGSATERQLRLRRLMAEQFTDMEMLTAAFGGEEGSTLITDRNTAALEVLRRQIERGDRRIAIFYGAGHMEDFDRRLRKDFGLQPRETVWLEAWDLREPAATPAGSR